MAKKSPRLEPTVTQNLSPLRTDCPHCGRTTWADYSSRRTVATLAGLTRLNLAVRRCHNPHCQAHLRLYRPEAEGRFALPRHEFGLDVVALAGALRYLISRIDSRFIAKLRGKKPDGPTEEELQAQEREEEARATAQLEQFRETQRAVFGVDPDVCRNDEVWS